MVSTPRAHNLARSSRRRYHHLIPLVLFLTLTIWNHSSAQNAFERTYGGESYDSGQSVQQISDGGYIVAGTTYSFGAGNADVYLIKTNAFGDTLWTKTYGGSLSDLATSVEQTSDGGYIVAGFTESLAAGDLDIYLIKTNDLGDTLWTKTYGDSLSDLGNSVQQTTDGGYIVAGYSYLVPRDEDVFLVKTDANGDTLWTKTFGDTSAMNSGNSVQQTTDGGYIIVGSSLIINDGNIDIYLIRTDALGEPLWTKTFDASFTDVAYSVQETSDGGYIIADGTAAFDPNGDMYLIRTTASGDTLWTRTFGGDGYDEALSAQQLSDGGFAVVGFKDVLDVGSGDVSLIRTDASGDTLWTRTYGGDSSDEGKSVQETSDGEFIIAGYTYSFGSGFADVYLIHTDTRSPTPVTAAASDNTILLPGIDDDDQVLIQFSEPTNQPLIDATNIDQILSLSGGHTWTDALGGIGGIVWGPAGDRVLISLSTTFAPPTVAVGDTITPDGTTIRDLWGNPAASHVITTGSFDPVGIGDSDEKSLLPKAFSLSQNYPNPFNPMTTIRYTIPEVTGKVSVRLTIHDLRGRLVRQLFEGEQGTGFYQLTWDGRDESGGMVGSGIYIYSIHAGAYAEKMKMTVIR
jgi:hypothetical protein